MRVAYLYSGLYRTWKGQEENHRSNLPEGDFYYSTWDSERKGVTREDMMFFPDPPKTYNCYAIKEFCDTYGGHLQHKPAEKKRAYTAYFQHLAHWYILNEVKYQRYDVVVRMRYDVIMGMGKKKFTELLKLCYNTGKSIGIGNTGSPDDENKAMHFQIPQATSRPIQMLDFVNIHKPEVCEDVQSLVDQKKMFPTNAGWYQVLGKNGHLNFRGGVQLKRYA